MGMRAKTATDLTAFAPPQCPAGHVLRYGGRKEAAFIPGRAQNSFVLCSCPAAVAKPGASGHLEVLCGRCLDSGVHTGWRDPPCEEWARGHLS
jgi:hypothetical protein